MSCTDLLNNHFNNEALASFLNNVTSENLANVIYDGSRLKWCNDLTSLKTFVAEVLCQNGKWCSPGGYSKKFISSNAELTLTWHQGKQNTLLYMMETLFEINLSVSAGHKAVPRSRAMVRSKLCQLIQEHRCHRVNTYRGLSSRQKRKVFI